jgi:hypothetical protein
MEMMMGSWIRIAAMVSLFLAPGVMAHTDKGGRAGKKAHKHSHKKAHKHEKRHTPRKAQAPATVKAKPTSSKAPVARPPQPATSVGATPQSKAAIAPVTKKANGSGHIHPKGSKKKTRPTRMGHDHNHPHGKHHGHGSDGLTPNEKALLDKGLSEAQRVTVASGLKILPKIGLLLNTSLAWFSGEAGAGQFGEHDPLANGFNLNQLELSMGASVGPFFRLQTFIIFSMEGVEIEEAVAQTTRLPGGFKLRTGLFNHRIGRVNAQHLHSWSFLDLPVAYGKFFGAAGSRGLGLELNWLIPVSWYSELIASATMLGVGHTANRSFSVADEHHAEEGEEDADAHGHGSLAEVDHPKDLLYSFAWKNYHLLGGDWGLKWGLSASLGPHDAHRAEIYGIDLHLRYRPHTSRRRAALTLQSEMLLRRRHLETETLTDWGGYAQMVWRLNKRWELGLRYGFGSGAENDPLDPNWTTLKQRGSLVATFYPSHFSRIRLQANVHNMEHVENTGEVLDERTHDEQAYGHEDLGYSIFLAVEFFIGSHPTHSY